MSVKGGQWKLVFFGTQKWGNPFGWLWGDYIIIYIKYVLLLSIYMCIICINIICMSGMNELYIYVWMLGPVGLTWPWRPLPHTDTH
jgi:hypothetical protein